MLYLMQGIFLITLLIGFRLILQGITRVPDNSAKKALKQQKTKKDFGEKLILYFVIPLAKLISPSIKLTDEQERELRQILARAEINLTPEEYYAKAYCSLILIFPFIVFAIIIGAMFLLPVIGFIGGVMVVHNLREAKDILKIKNREIEEQLPNFIRSIVNKIKNSQKVVTVDLIEVFEDYLKISDKVFRYDINELIIDMKSKNFESALRGFDKRVNVMEVSHLCNALVAMVRGENQKITLLRIASDMDLKARENYKKKLDLLPGKVKWAALPLVLVSIATLLMVLVSHLMYSLSGII